MAGQCSLLLLLLLLSEAGPTEAGLTVAVSVSGLVFAAVSVAGLVLAALSAAALSVSQAGLRRQ